MHPVGHETLMAKSEVGLAPSVELPSRGGRVNFVSEGKYPSGQLFDWHESIFVGPLSFEGLYMAERLSWLDRFFSFGQAQA